jgi:hypothetical protein
MIPEIGVMLAAYIVTRMLALIVTRNDATSQVLQFGQIIAKIFAGVTIIVAVIVAIDLALRGTAGVSLPELR